MVLKADRFIAAGVAVLLAVSADDVGASTATDGIQPHRAAYTISLLRADAASDVVDVRGRMAFEWRDDCEGWGVDQLFAMDFAYSTGSSIELRSTYKTWEAKDGSRYSAKVERTRSGDAESHSVDAGPGEAVFKGEETATFALSEGTLFPTAHTLALIEQGLANSRFLSVPVFDGGEVEPDGLISAVIGKEKSDEPPIDMDGLTNTYWPIQLAFFNPAAEAQNPTPDFEMRLGLQRNGITREMVVTYGTFAITMKLAELELITDGGC